MTFHAESAKTGGKFGLIEAIATPGSEPPLHVHQNEDEVFYLLEGKLQVRQGDDYQIVNPGDSVFLPRDVPHTFKVLSSQARSLIYFTPAGFEGFFREVAEVLKEATGSQYSAARMARIAQKYGITYLT